jgi:uncharacterized membrane protein YkvA (DUF1232 family)
LHDTEQVFDVKSGRPGRVDSGAAAAGARLPTLLAPSSPDRKDIDTTSMAPARPRRSSGRLRTGRLIGRALSLAAFLPVASRAPMYARLVWALAGEPRVPLHRKVVLAGAAGYFLLGRDVIPDTIPIIGGIDDLIVVVLAIEVFLEGIPDELLAEKLDELGIEQTAFERDITRIRRLTPGPIRRLIREAHAFLDRAAASIQASLAGLRGSNERSPAA